MIISLLYPRPGGGGGGGGGVIPGGGGAAPGGSGIGVYVETGSSAITASVRFDRPLNGVARRATMRSHMPPNFVIFSTRSRF